MKWRRVAKEAFYRVLWFFLKPTLRLLAGRSQVILTCSRIDGGGAQWHGRFSVMAFANYFGYKYVHSDFHRVVPLDEPDVRQKWSNLFRGNYVKISESPNKIKVKTLREVLRLTLSRNFKDSPIVVDIDHLHIFTDWFPDTIEKAIEKFQISYNNPSDLEEAKNDSLKSLVVHVRRGLEFERNFTSNRQTSDEVVLKNVLSVHALNPELQVTVYSGKPLPGLQSIAPKEWIFDHTSNEFEVIHSMINSNVLIMAKSCLSYIGATFSKGAVYYENFFHPPLKNWKRLESEQ